MDNCQSVSAQVWTLRPFDGPSAAPPPPAPAERADHRCGPSFDNARCAPSRCCSVHGWCGSRNESHCSTERGFGGRFDGP